MDSECNQKQMYLHTTLHHYSPNSVNILVKIDDISYKTCLWAVSAKNISFAFFLDKGCIIMQFFLHFQEGINMHISLRLQGI